MQNFKVTRVVGPPHYSISLEAGPTSSWRPGQVATEGPPGGISPGRNHGRPLVDCSYVRFVLQAMMMVIRSALSSRGWDQLDRRCLGNCSELSFISSLNDSTQLCVCTTLANEESVSGKTKKISLLQLCIYLMTRDRLRSEIYLREPNPANGYTLAQFPVLLTG